MESFISLIVGIILIGGILYIAEKISAKNEKIKSLEREQKQLVEDFEKRKKKKEKKKLKKQARELEELSPLDKLERYQKKRKKEKKKMIRNEELLEEAMNHVANLHTVRMYDTTWDEYLQYIHESPKYKPAQKNNINWDVILFGYKVLSVIGIILLINTL